MEETNKQSWDVGALAKVRVEQPEKEECRVL